MAFDLPAVFAGGEVVAATKLNQVRDSLSYLYNGRETCVLDKASQTLPNAALEGLTFPTETVDTNSMHSTSSNTWRITVPTTGVYLMVLSGIFEGNATGVRTLWLDDEITGALPSYASLRLTPDGTDPVFASVSDVRPLAAGSKVDARAEQTSNGDLALTNIHFAVVRIG